MTVLARLTAGAHELVAETARDMSVFALIAANAATIVVALWAKWDLRELMLVYWAQSVIIGVSFFIRLLALARHTAGPFSDYLNAAFFLVHYGFFHLVYLLFLTWQPPGLPPLSNLFWLCVACFVLSHAYSLWRNIRLDREGRPSPMTLFCVPYARILPMHLTLILGSQVPASGALLFFLLLKTLADVVMHVVEHQVLRAGRARS